MKNIIRCIVDLTFTGLVDYDKRNNIELTGSIIVIILQLPWFIKIPLKLYIMLTELSTLIKSTFFKEDVFLCSARQVLLLEKSLKNLLDLRSETSNTDLTERAFIVRSSVDLLREVFGEIYNDEVLDSVFNGFCVGK